MATYIVLGNFTDQGIRNVKDTVKRAETLRQMAKKCGATVKDVYWTLGAFDTLSIIEAPDEAAITALGLSVGTSGNLRTQTLRAFSADEIAQVLTRMG
jgi:uncharacterized protein with GYD domain